MFIMVMMPEPHVAERLARRGGTLALLLDEFGDQAGPANLVAGADARAGLAVEILMERRVVAPVRVVLEGGAEHRPPATCVGGEDRDQPVRKLVGDRIQCQVVARAGRTFDRESSP
jgi:hypothetical protein